MFSQTLTIERISFSIFLVIAGIFLMTAVIWSIIIWGEIMNDQVLAKGGSINYFFLLKEFHPMAINSTLLITSGFLILSKRKIGWTLGTALCTYHCIFMPITFILLMKSPHDSVNHTDSISPFFFTIYALIILLFLLTLLFLLFPKTRIQFNTTNVQYRNAAGIAVLLVADKFIF
ncbi:MAG: hypothetical protein HYZ14_09895 [Bacteroidetes bacterium]|nr:hypothetical protein [Bacteroidota bacterium]